MAFAPPSFTVTAVDERPTRVANAELTAEIEQLQQLIVEAPRERTHRFALVRALIDAGELDQALAAAEAWREIDAYNLVVVRLIGDIQTELGDAKQALRTYSAVTELLSEDPEAQRALATVLKAQGDLDNALARLQVATQLRPEDQRLSFELADVELRRGNYAQAAARFEAIVADEGASEQLRHPAKQRLAQVYAGFRRDANTDAQRREWTAKIDALALEGGSQNDIKVYLTWDTDRTDVDLWVINPKGEKVFYSHRQGAFGGTLYGDVTTGYGPESFTAKTAKAGTYAVEVNYYGSGGAMKEARGELLVVVNEGREDEQQHTFPYVLPKVGDSVRVAKIEVK
ncbi:tetratricopeptide repeat protein [Enhygromyxa salina]|uniref:tetratricopeptide repeat protein n=1 Tax=Enhygromyxa salina TaxID=215803 RepID=UPI000D03BC66|nr:tetratricopeptide repeat protein [Enhygromyxa salina]